MKDLIIIGAGSVGGHVAMNAEAYGISERIIGFLDDNPQKLNTDFCGYSVISDLSWLEGKSELSIVLGVAFPKIKRQIFDKFLEASSFICPTLIHPRAWISEGCKIGPGSIIYPNTSVNYGSEVGKFCVVNMNCALGHHAKIGDFSSLAPGVNLGGHTTLDEQVDMGIGSSTLQNVHIGAKSVIGGQSMIIDSISSSSKVMGVPAHEK